MLKECGVNKDVVTNMKRGQMPSADKLILIAHHLETSAEYLMGLTDDPTPNQKDGEANPMEPLEQFLATSGLSEKSKRDLLEQLELLKMRDKLKKLNEEAEEEKLKPRLN